MDHSDADGRLAASLELVESAIAFIRRRHCLSADEAEDLRGELRVRLVAGKALAAFSHRSSLRTYLTTIAHHALLDLRNKRWQKWRPSIEAKRLGPLALRLEELLVRDGRRLDEAYQELRSNHGVACTYAEIEAVARRLPPRVRRHFVGEEAIRGAAGSDSADLEVLQSERGVLAGRISAALDQAINRMDPEDRLVLKMRFYDGLRISEIARLLGLDQARLYRRIEALLRDLRSRLEGEGFGAADVAEVTGDPATPVEASAFADPDGIAALGPSK